MKFLDTTVRLRYDSAFSNFSKKFPQAKMALWCLNTNEMLYISAPSDGEVVEMIKVAKTDLEVERTFVDGSSAVTSMNICSCSDPDSINAMVNASGCWVIPPITYSDGWASYRIFSPNKAALQRFVRRAEKDCEVEILSHHGREDLDLILDIGIIPVHLFEGLSDRQLKVLSSAYESGLLDVPARAEMDQVAEREGVSRSTYGEHLRKSIYKLVSNSYPLLKAGRKRR